MGLNWKKINSSAGRASRRINKTEQCDMFISESVPFFNDGIKIKTKIGNGVVVYCDSFIDGIVILKMEDGTEKKFKIKMVEKLDE